MTDAATDYNGRPYMLPGFTPLTEPRLLFDSEDEKAVALHPLRGLAEYGPFSRNQLGVVPNPIKVATIAPSAQTGVLAKLLRELEMRHYPRERKVYVPEFLGFSKIFNVGIAHAGSSCRLELGASLDRDIATKPEPHEILARAILQSINVLRTSRSDFDVVLLYLPERWQRAFEQREGDNFDLHDFLKANTASLGIPLQIVNDDKTGAITYFCRCSVAWRLSIALYCKSGGTPWTLADGDLETAYIGLSYALRPASAGKARFAICCSQVFDAEGAGLDFVAYEAEDVQIFGKNPFLNRHQMFKVMSRSLDIYRRRHSGHKPRRVAVHKNTEFRRGEIDGCFDALSTVHDVELVHVQQNVSWRGVFVPERKKIDPYPVPRGFYLPLSETEALLWTQGNARSIVGGNNFYKEGRGIPEPLLIKRFAGQNDLRSTCRAILALSKMDWNNDGPYDRLPVTLNFASILANIVKRIQHLEAKPYPFRLFM
jgi:hypothetical protein